MVLQFILTFDMIFNPLDLLPPNLPKQVPTGVYIRSFKITRDFMPQYIFLQVGSAKTGLFVSINAQKFAYSEDLNNPTNFLINKYI